MEFGSDFHELEFQTGKSLLEYYPESNLYASGRQAIIALAIARRWSRLWVPSYFCEETLEYLPKAEVKLMKYKITPYDNPSDVIHSLPLTNQDSVLVVNYFGFYNRQDFSDMPCEILEDHTHNLISDWAINSSADWCFASLRKTLPISDGGILWSPQKLTLPSKAYKIPEVEQIMDIRRDAMVMKSRYLSGDNIDKLKFLQLYRDTEICFDSLPISEISSHARDISSSIGIDGWYAQKRNNWLTLRDKVKLPVNVKLMDNMDADDTLFSFILIFDDSHTRNMVRQQLISKSIYPAILWTISSDFDPKSKDFGERMLSIHCDGRYSKDDMLLLAKHINDALQWK